jgi:hypothetical protein
VNLLDEQDLFSVNARHRGDRCPLVWLIPQRQVSSREEVMNRR